MMKKSTKIVFFGNERIATGVTTKTPTLNSLINEGYEVVAVISNYEKPTSRNVRKLEIAQTAESLKVPFYTPSNTKELTEILSKIGAEIGVLVAYGKIIPQSVIKLFPYGIVNIHPSELPKHRGSIPIEAAILEGASSTAVSIMKLVADMDAGPIYAQTRVSIKEYATKQELADTLLDIGSKTLIDVLPSILDGSCRAQEQDNSKATYDTRISKEDGIIDWRKDASTISREIRAFASWPKSRARISGVEVIITAGHPSMEPLEAGKPQIQNSDTLIVGCGKGSLVIDKIQPLGKKEMDAKSFINGYRDLLID